MNMLINMLMNISMKPLDEHLMNMLMNMLMNKLMKPLDEHFAKPLDEFVHQMSMKLFVT